MPPHTKPKRPSFSERSNNAVKIVREVLKDNHMTYMRLYREKRVSGVDGYSIKFYGLRTTLMTDHGVEHTVFKEIGKRISGLGLMSILRRHSFNDPANIYIYDTNDQNLSN